MTGRRICVFYADDGILGLQYPECLQGALNVLIGLFRRIGLAANVSNLKTMNFQLGEILLGMSVDEFPRRSTGEGDNYLERLRRRMLCPDCGVEMMEIYLKYHRRKLYGTNPKIDWDRIPVSQHKHLPQVYEIILPRDSIKCQCPFTGCIGSSRNRGGLRNHFKRLHWWDSN